MRIRWLGHAAFQVESEDGVLYIDPWLENPMSPVRPSDVDRADVIVVTHDHHDHLGNAVEIAKRTGAVVVAVPELASYLSGMGVETHAPNMGAKTVVRGFGVTLVQAFHTCSRGFPTGVIVETEGKSLYHMGDTAIFGGLTLIAELYKPEIVMVPIGGFYTMGPMEAAKAVEILKPRVAIPMHYGTFPVLVKTPDSFVRLVQERAPEVRVLTLKPGGVYEE